MMAVDIAGDIEQIIVGLVVLLLAAVFSAAVALRRNQQRIQAVLAKEFGGNSGGIRQAINDMDERLSDRLDDVSVRLDGHISQHVEQGFK